jgi:hypothetical protein
LVPEELMTQNSSIYWATEEIARRARELAEAKEMSVSALVSALVDSEYQNHFIPSFSAVCPSCKAYATFTFVAHWPSQSDLYRCNNCRTALQRDTIESDQPKSLAERVRA